MIDEAEVLRQAQLNIRQGIQSPDIAEGAEYADTPEGAQFLIAVYHKMNQLVAAGYQSQPMPPLGKPKILEDGSLRFLARSQDMVARAEDALESKGVESWVFFDGEEDQIVMGRVTEVEYVEALAYFTVRPDEAK